MSDSDGEPIRGQDSAVQVAPIGASALRVLLSDNIGAITSLGYLLLIGIGLLHEVVLFRLFGVNVLDWMGPTDFLLVPMRDPLVILAAIAPVIAAWAYWKITLETSNAIQRKRERAGKAPTTYGALNRRMLPYMKQLWITMLLLWAVAAALWYALYKAKTIRAGGASSMRIEWVDSARGDTASVVLLGANASYLVIYKPARDSTQIVPSAQVLRVSVARRKRS